MRAGTENVAAIFGLARAMEDAAVMPDTDRIRQMQRRLFEGLQTVPGCVINGTCSEDKRLPGNVNVSFPGLDAESLVLHLDRAGICCSAASACTSGVSEPSHVLLAIGCDRDTASSSLRFTLGKRNTMEEVEYIITQVHRLVTQLYAENRVCIL